MSKKEKKVVGLVVGLALFFVGWAFRSTVPIAYYHNKPVGGAMMAIGMFVFGIFLYKLLKR